MEVSLHQPSTTLTKDLLRSSPKTGRNWSERLRLEPSHLPNTLLAHSPSPTWECLVSRTSVHCFL